MSVNFKEIDVSSLPWLPMEENLGFPRSPAIYFAIDSLGNIQYIGRSVNPKQRWGQHHQYEKLAKLGGIRIAYLFIEAKELLPEIEKALIEWFKPSLNQRLNSKLVKQKSEYNPEAPLNICPLGSLLNLLSGPWTFYILWIFRNNGPTRFGALKRQMEGISSKVLTERLRMLEEAEIIYREYKPIIPPEVTYGLTERGRDLIVVLDQLAAIAHKWYEQERREKESVPASTSTRE